MAKSTFSHVDFVIFFASLLSSALIGIYFAWKDRAKTSTGSYMHGDGKMNIFAVAMSMCVSWTSAITVIAMPSEVYRYGIVFAWMGVGFIIGNVFAAMYFVPFIYRNKINTVYEYLEIRFGRSLRILCSTVSNIQQLFYMGITTYLPALALNAITNISLEWSIVITSGICTFYTALGGIKAVIWTDVVQSMVMLFGMLFVFIKTTVIVGGFGSIYEAAERGGRNNILKNVFDPRVPTTIPGIICGYIFYGLYGSAAGQIMVQRYLCCKTLTQAKIATYLHVVPILIFVFTSMANGMAMYAYYEGCDPKLAGKVKKIDQSLPLLVVQVFEKLPGVAGIFVAAAYSGTLSTVSSGINSMAQVIMNDYVLLVRPKMSLKRRLILSKILSCLVGISVLLLAYVVSKVGGTMVQFSLLMYGSLCGPILGVLILGTFVPFVNSKGAKVAFLFGIVLGLWIMIGKLIYGENPVFKKPLNFSVEQCGFNFTKIQPTILTYDENFTSNNATDASTYQDATSIYGSGFTTESTEESTDRGILQDTLYSISSYYTGIFTLTTTILFGFIASIFTRSKCEDADPNLFIPLISNHRFPERVRKHFRMGVPEISDCCNDSEQPNHDKTRL